MADPEVNPRKQDKSELLNKVAELEKAVVALLKGMKDAEKEIDEPLMPEGTYFGIEFKD